MNDSSLKCGGRGWGGILNSSSLLENYEKLSYEKILGKTAEYMQEWEKK